MSQSFLFKQVARLPLPGDNVAIATRLLEAGTKINYQNQTLTLDYTVLEGHRFAVRPIAQGEALLSWELPFGIASQEILPGNYVINKGVLEELQGRSLSIDIPSKPNFHDQIDAYQVDETNFKPAQVVPAHSETRTFLGYRRSTARGVGTRNTIILLGTTSRTGSYVKELSSRLGGELNSYANIDAIVPVAHTEGGAERPNNLDFLLRALAGFIVNPNVGAVLVVDYGNEQVNNKMVEDYMNEHNYPLQEVTHCFLSLNSGFEEQLNEGESIVRNWLPMVNAIERTAQSVSHLKIGLQCGGSDAFSGVSANPLLGWISKELVRYGGAANLAETDELIGAESYILHKVRNLETARKFLSLIETFRERTSWHGADPEGNPSGGNKYRGLYNIYLKSIGAAQKKDPDTRIDHVIEYGAPMEDGGFHFMDSPGNDLESIAGQVASGCNLVFFATGNGSITNFPFVPTIKVVTTTARFQLLDKDMDVNAGQYQDGKPMEELGSETFDLMLEIASGQRSVGEKAGHSQVQIWRNWQQTDESQLNTLRHAPTPTGESITIKTDAIQSHTHFSFNVEEGHGSNHRIGLILPTSLCAGQVAKMIASDLNSKWQDQQEEISQFVALPHTEGCGNSGGDAELLYTRTMMGYMNHPLVKHCLLLEHGCEKTHNAFMRNQIEKMGGDSGGLGFASIQLDGGIDKVKHKVQSWFDEHVTNSKPIRHKTVGLEGLRIGIMSDGAIQDETDQQLAALTKMIVGAGGQVVIPQSSPLLSANGYTNQVFTQSNVLPSLSYGEHAHQQGFHIMETPTQHWVENLTGLAATGVELIVAMVNNNPMQAHPFVPVLQMTSHPSVQQSYRSDMDLFLTGDPHAWNDQILELCKQVMERRYSPRLYQQGNIDFQFTRGLLGVSL